MTESIWPEQTGHYLVLGKTGSGKTTIQRDVMDSLLKASFQHPPVSPDRGDIPPESDGEASDE